MASLSIYVGQETNTTFNNKVIDDSFKDVHRRQKLTTDFFQTFWVDHVGCDYLNFEKKNMVTVVSRGSFFKGRDNKIIGFNHIQ